MNNDEDMYIGEVIAAALVIILLVVGLALCVTRSDVDAYNRTHRSRSTLDVR